MVPLSLNPEFSPRPFMLDRWGPKCPSRTERSLSNMFVLTPLHARNAAPFDRQDSRGQPWKESTCVGLGSAIRVVFPFNSFSMPPSCSTGLQMPSKPRSLGRGNPYTMPKPWMLTCPRPFPPRIIRGTCRIFQLPTRDSTISGFRLSLLDFE